MKPGKNKIPSPSGGWDNNSVDETREQQDPIPSFQRGWDNNSEDETTQKQDPIPLAGEWDKYIW